MAFQIKNFVSIVASMINRMKATQSTITDFNVGSVARTMVEAPASEIDQLYQQMFNGLQEAIPVATYNSFNFGLLPAVAASGLLTATITAQTSDTLIPAGTLATLAGGATPYATLTDTTIPAGDTSGQLLIAATAAGALGNVGADQNFVLAPAPNGFVSATNVAAISSGADAETPAQRTVRFQQYIASIARGVNGAIEYGLTHNVSLVTSGVVTERVASAIVVEPYLTDTTQPTGLINAYIHNGVGGTSDALLAQAQLVVDGYYVNGNAVIGWKSAGVICNCYKATEIDVAVTGVLTTAAGYTHADLVTDAEGVVANYILGVPQGRNVILAEIYALVMAIPGVTNWVPSVPSADVAITGPQKAMPGTITIT